MYEQFVRHLQLVCQKQGVELECYGSFGKRPQYKLYSVTLSDDAKENRRKRTVCFSAGIHGDEIAGPWASARFIEEYDAQEYPDVRIVILPVLNPHGFSHARRRNDQNIDMNRHFFDEPLRTQNQFILSRLMQEEAYLFCTLHEDPREKRFYMYNYQEEDEPIYHDLIAAASEYFPINRSRKICGDAAKGGLVTNLKDTSLECRVWREGVKRVITLETPGKEDLSRRIECGVRLMREIVRYCGRD